MNCRDLDNKTVVILTIMLCCVSFLMGVWLSKEWHDTTQSACPLCQETSCTNTVTVINESQPVPSCDKRVLDQCLQIYKDVASIGKEAQAKK